MECSNTHYARTRGWMLGQIKHLVGYEDAEDVLHEVWLRVLEDPRATWLKLAIREQAHQWLAKRQRIVVGLDVRNLADAMRLGDVVERKLEAERLARVLTADEIAALLNENEKKPTGELARRMRIAKRKAREALCA